MNIIEISMIQTELEKCTNSLLDAKESAIGSNSKICSKEAKLQFLNSFENARIAIENRFNFGKGTKLEELKDIVFGITGITESDMQTRTRKREISMPRMVILAVYFKAINSVTAQDSADVYGMDHASTTHACKTINNLKNTDKFFRNEYQKVWDWAIIQNPKFDLLPTK